MKLSAHQMVMVTRDKDRVFTRLRERRDREWVKAVRRAFGRKLGL